MRSRSLSAFGTSLALFTLAACGSMAPQAASPERTAAQRDMQPPFEAEDAKGASEPATATVSAPPAADAPAVEAAPPPPPAPAKPAGPARKEAAPSKASGVVAATKAAAGAPAQPSAPPPSVASHAAETRQAAAISAPTPVATPVSPPALPGAVGAAPPEAQGTEDYHDYGVNPETDPAKDRFSTFAIDVDTASYSIARRKIMEGSLPPYSAVRAEEFLNSFDYEYPSPASGAFAVHLAAAPSPFTPGHHLVRVGVQGKRISADSRSPVHLVYLVDTSGSMQSEDKIGLAKKSLKLLTDSLKPGDTVALCTYAGYVREVLAPTGVDQRERIRAAIDDLTASGSTAMASGIELAYSLAERTRVPGHVNRVIVLSDGDANVGPTSHEEIIRSIRDHKAHGITLSTVGFGMGNYKDTMMEQLADSGDGNYSYIDSEAEARHVFSDQVSGLLQVIARDVKIQVEFDPAVVKQYRLIGYENRDVADKDFRNDKVDAGEIGSGHNVTALYDVILKSTTASPLVVRVRNKTPLGSETAEEQAFRLDPSAIAATFDAAPANLRFAAAVGGFAEILRKSPQSRSWRMADVLRIARGAAKDRKDQQELIEVVRRAEALSGGGAVAVAQ